ncbi:hypothetical protein STCU_10153 [Strigomonas culicis]|uniref:Uncharacterized protein n=1 Tax=Strigomonas culicis TaxID=28005 RepID=S9TP30_9TRYP|nr:hypothetical protein STCU_10153 [Strigomonas culicis]|eukprot:EPY18153.1 hypothetical protein STCU_10153 [Strigomonas culicis]
MLAELQKCLSDMDPAAAHVRVQHPFVVLCHVLSWRDAVERYRAALEDTAWARAAALAELLAAGEVLCARAVACLIVAGARAVQQAVARAVAEPDATRRERVRPELAELFAFLRDTEGVLSAAVARHVARVVLETSLPPFVSAVLDGSGAAEGPSAEALQHAARMIEQCVGAGVAGQCSLMNLIKRL